MKNDIFVKKGAKRNDLRKGRIPEDIQAGVDDSQIQCINHMQLLQYGKTVFGNMEQ
jgi:hypothetical protein